MTDENTRIHIIGAGISGLVCALELERAGYSPVVIESQSNIGGRVQTEMYNDIPLDEGFQVLLTAYPAAQRYLDYDALDLCTFEPGAVIMEKDKQERIGDFLRQPSFFIPTLTSRLATIGDKLRMYSLSRKLRNKDPEEFFSGQGKTTFDYLREYGFSREIIDKFFKPFYGGIFLEKDLSTSSKMFEFTFGMFAKGSAAIPQKGMAEIPRQLARLLKNTDIKLNTQIRILQEKTIILDDNSKVNSDIIISTTENIFSEKKKQWKGCSTHYFTTNKNLIEQPIIALNPNPDRSINTFHDVTTLINSNSSTRVISATVINTPGVIDISPKIVRDELAVLLDSDDIEHIKSCYIEHSLPEIEDPAYTPAPEQVRRGNGIYLAGDIASNGSINGAMESGRLAARTVIADLEET